MGTRRGGGAYRKWHSECYQRDRFAKARCYFCKQRIDYSLKQGDPKKGEPYQPEAYEAHHKKSWDEYPELRYVVSNGAASHARCNRHEGKHEADSTQTWNTAEDWSDSHVSSNIPVSTPPSANDLLHLLRGESGSRPERSFGSFGDYHEP